MPSRFDKYRAKDGVTRLGEAYFNPVFKDIDLRLSAIESLRISWEQAVRTVSDFGLVRINEIIGPAGIEVITKVDEIEAKRQAAIAALADLQATIAGGVVPANAIGAANGVAALDSTGRVPKPQLPAVGLTMGWAPTNAPHVGNVGFTLPPGDDGSTALVEGLGLFAYSATSTEYVDGETCIASSTGIGRWLQALPAWDFVWAYLAGLFTEQGESATSLESRATSLESRATSLEGFEGKFIAASGSLDFPSIATLAAGTLTLTVSGAALGAAVLLTPPAALDVGLLPTAWVSAPDTVTVQLTNITGATINAAALTYLVTVINP